MTKRTYILISESYLSIQKKILVYIFIVLSLLGCSRQPSNQAQGYIEGRYTYIATSVSGVLEELLVNRGQSIKKGQLLFKLEQQPESDSYSSALENFKESVAARDSISANLTYAKLTYERYKILVPKQAIQQSQLDNAKSIYNSTQAQLAQANAAMAASQATLASAKWKLDQKSAYAPVDGIVFDTYYRLGEYTIANQAILALLAPADIKAIFYVSEKYLNQIKLRDKVIVTCEGCPNYTAFVSFISPTAEYTPPVIYSNETNVKLIYRMEARFSNRDAISLHPGQPITVVFRHE